MDVPEVAPAVLAAAPACAAPSPSRHPHRAAQESKGGRSVGKLWLGQVQCAPVAMEGGVPFPLLPWAVRDMSVTCCAWDLAQGESGGTPAIPALGVSGGSPPSSTEVRRPTEPHEGSSSLPSLHSLPNTSPDWPASARERAASQVLPSAGFISCSA